MSTKLTAGDYFALKNQLFKLLAYKDGDEKTGHSSANLAVITECLNCGEQREERGNSTNFKKCLRCRVWYDKEKKERIEPTDAKDIVARDKNMLRAPKVFEEDYIDTPVNKRAPTTRANRALREKEEELEEEEAPPPPKTKSRKVSRVQEVSDDEEDTVVEKKSSLADFAKASIDDLIAEAGAKTEKEMESRKKDRAKAKFKETVVVDEGEELEEDDFIVKKPTRKAMDITKSETVVVECDQPAAKLETLKVVRLKKGQTFMHGGILFIAE